VLDIARSVSAELGPVSLADVHAYLKVLERAGLITFRSVAAKTDDGGRGKAQGLWLTAQGLRGLRP